MKTRTVLAVLLVLQLVACGKPPENFAWKQDVPLQDGRVIVLDRESRVGAEDVLQRQRIEGGQVLAFTHPETQERIEWIVPKGLLPYMLDIDQGIPYYVFDPHTISDYNDWECPNPPFVVYKYVSGQWQRISLGDLPARFVDRNLLDVGSARERYMTNRYVSLDGIRQFIKDRDQDRKTISRNKIDANVHGCFGSVLIKLGRENEVTIPGGIPTSAKGAQK